MRMNMSLSSNAGMERPVCAARLPCSCFKTTAERHSLHIPHLRLVNMRKLCRCRYALTRMARLVASRSGFAETAAWAGNIPSRALVKAPGCVFSNGVEVPDGAEY